MALSASRLAQRSLPSSAVSTGTSPVCTAHTCRRCGAASASAEPCSLVPAHAPVCLMCQATEETVKHLPSSRSVWGASLLGGRRGLFF